MGRAGLLLTAFVTLAAIGVVAILLPRATAPQTSTPSDSDPGLPVTAPTATPLSPASPPSEPVPPPSVAHAAAPENLTLDEALGRLRSGTRSQRLEASAEFSRFGDAGIDALLKLLEHKQAVTRDIARFTLELVGPDATKVLPILERLILTSPENREAVQVLLAIGPRVESILALESAAAEAAYEDGVIIALEQLGVAAAPALMRLATPAADHYGDWAALSSLAALGEEHPSVVETTRHQFASSRGRLQFSLALLLSGFDPTPKESDTIVRVVADQFSSVDALWVHTLGWAAAEMLFARCERLPQWALLWLSDPRASVRVGALAVLAGLPERLPALERRLALLMDEGSEWEAMGAAAALARPGEDAALRARATARVIRAIGTESDTPSIESVVATFAQLWGHAARGDQVEFVRDALRSDDVELVRAGLSISMTALRLTGRTLPTLSDPQRRVLLDALRRHCENPDTTFRHRAIGIVSYGDDSDWTWLVNFGHRQVKANDAGVLDAARVCYELARPKLQIPVPILFELQRLQAEVVPHLGNESESVCDDVARTLVGHTLGDPAFAALVALLGHERPEARARALKMLRGQMRRLAPHVDAITKRFFEGSDAEQEAAAAIMAHLPTLSEETKEKLVRRLASESADGRRRAIRALGRFVTDDAYRAALEAKLADPDFRVRLTAARWVGLVLDGFELEKRVLPMIEDGLRSTDSAEVRVAVRAAIALEGVVGGLTQPIDAALARLKKKDGPWLTLTLELDRAVARRAREANRSEGR